MAKATISGFPRFGPGRELKWALEGFWSGKRTETELIATGKSIREKNWSLQGDAGIDLIPVNDFSFYDQMLDQTALFGAVPERYGDFSESISLETYFAMARGRAGTNDVTALDMTKWFDANYHYLVPELAPKQQFRIATDKPFAETREALALGLNAKPVLIGPLTWLALARGTDGNDPLDLLPALLPIYAEVVSRLAALGVTWIQIDEPILVTDRAASLRDALTATYETIATAAGSTSILLNAPFGHVTDVYDVLLNLPIAGLGLDFTRGPQSVALVTGSAFPQDKVLAAGVVDGRNIWRNDLSATLELLESLTSSVPADRLMVSTSCSLLHVPLDVELETDLDPAIKPWLAFATQKLAEVATLTRGLNLGRDAIATEIAASGAFRSSMASAAIRNRPAVRDRVANLSDNADQRPASYPDRARVQAEYLQLPTLPTTTIGSFPQTSELRAARKQFETHQMDAATYDQAMEQYIRATIADQEAIGLDVLVHGEPERNDMVQSFGEQLDGFVFTRHGWVQSYGSRMVRPPIIVGDVCRPNPMTVRWATFAQSLSSKPVKGMLTGPVTILNWSFVRDDQPRSETCLQIALAIRDEVADLETAGIGIIQIDEPAIREGLPLRRDDWDDYLDWATRAFRITAGVAAPTTQIHTHMCYSAFEDVIDAIDVLDADVLSIENARSDLGMLTVFQQAGYTKGIGPGVYDIHSPRIPPTDKLIENLQATLSVLDLSQVWVNPDCGLKTRKHDEAIAALTNMVAAARQLRQTKTNRI